MTQFKERAAGVAAALGGMMAPRAPRTPPQAEQGASNPGPDNPTLLGQFPSSFQPPHTDHGHVPNLWFPFSQAHRRIQPGGWSREVTVKDFVGAKDIAGVNMRLTVDGVRELHWHLAANGPSC